MASRLSQIEQARLEETLRAVTPPVRDAFLRVILEHANNIDLNALITALERRDVTAAIGIVQFREGQFFPLTEALRAGFMAGANAVSAPAAIRGSFGFDGRHPEAERLVRELGARLVTAITDDARDATRQVILTGLEANRGNRAVALEIVGRRDAGGVRRGGIIGLTAPMTDNVMEARAVLSDPARLAEYFRPDGSPRWRLSDRRFDALVRRAIAGKVRLTPADVDKIVDAHKSKALRFRGDLVAKNESRSAVAQGQYEAYRQMGDNPNIDRIEVTWSHGLSADPRMSHVRMSGQKVRLGQRFELEADGETPGASMLYPHDPAGGAAHNLNCRCVAIMRAVPRIRR